MITCDACKSSFETMRKLRSHQVYEGHPLAWKDGAYVGLTVEQAPVPVPEMARWS